MTTIEPRDRPELGGSPGGEPLTPDEAVEKLAERLFEKMEHLDPVGEPPWAALSEDERDFYRFSVQALICERALILLAAS